MVSRVSCFASMVQDREGNCCPYRTVAAVATVVALAVAVFGLVTCCTRRLLGTRFSAALIVAGGGIAVLGSTILVAKRNSAEMRRSVPHPEPDPVKVIFDRLKAEDSELTEQEKIVQGKLGEMSKAYATIGLNKSIALQEGEAVRDEFAFVVLNGCKLDGSEMGQPFDGNVDEDVYFKAGILNIALNRVVTLYWKEGATNKDVLRTLYRSSGELGSLGHLVRLKRNGGAKSLLPERVLDKPFTVHNLTKYTYFFY